MLTVDAYDDDAYDDAYGDLDPIHKAELNGFDWYVWRKGAEPKGFYEVDPLTNEPDLDRWVEQAAGDLDAVASLKKMFKKRGLYLKESAQRVGDYSVHSTQCEADYLEHVASYIDNILTEYPCLIFQDSYIQAHVEKPAAYIRANLINWLPKVTSSRPRPDESALLVPVKTFGGKYFILNTCPRPVPPKLPKTKGSQEAYRRAKTLIRWLVRCQFPRVVERRIIWQFTADTLRNPYTRPQYALLITGEIGTGKSLFFTSLLKDALGTSWVLPLPTAKITGQEQVANWRKNMMVVIDDYKQQDISSSDDLKFVVTASSTNVRELYKQAVREQIISRLVFISNKDNPVRFNPDEGDRRFFMPQRTGYAWNPQTKTHDKDASVALTREVIQACYIDGKTGNGLRPEAIKALLDLLMEVDLTDFDSGVPLDTETKRRAIENAGGINRTMIEVYADWCHGYASKNNFEIWKQFYSTAEGGTDGLTWGYVQNALSAKGWRMTGQKKELRLQVPRSINPKKPYLQTGFVSKAFAQDVEEALQKIVADDLYDQIIGGQMTKG